MADGTGIKQKKGAKSELRAVIGVTTGRNGDPLIPLVMMEISKLLIIGLT